MRPIVICATLLAATTAAFAQETPAPAARPQAAAKLEAKPPVIAVVDMALVFSKSLLGKSYTAQLAALQNEFDAEQTKKQNELSKKDAEIKTLQEELERQTATQAISDEAREKRVADIKKKQRERAAYFEDGQAELEKLRDRGRERAQQFQGDFQQKIRPHIDAVAKARGVDIVIDKQAAIVLNQAYEISEDVIVRSDDFERANKAKAGVGAKPSSPPAAPAASPSPVPSPTPKS